MAYSLIFSEQYIHDQSLIIDYFANYDYWEDGGWERRVL